MKRLKKNIYTVATNERAITGSVNVLCATKWFITAKIMVADYQQKEIFMKKKIIAVVLGLALCFGMTGCASWGRMVTDIKSDVNGGMQRTITVYTADGKELATYEGKIDLSTNDGGYVKFDFDGKRYIYYNCFVESIADID